MTGGGKTLYPMLGVGAFFVMFWVGFVVGFELGLLEIADAHPSARRSGPTDDNIGMRRRESRPTVLLPNPFVSR
jgi:hypothetical protein